MSDHLTTYLLPCSCGREIPIEPRQAGAAVQCVCGRICNVPTLREIRALRPAPVAVAAPAAKAAWGNPQRFLVAGLAIVLLASVAAAILYTQLPAHFRGLPPPEVERQRVKKMSTLQTMEYFHSRLLPGIDYYEKKEVQNERSIDAAGLVGLAAVAVVGLLLAAVGVVGLARRRGARISQMS